MSLTVGEHDEMWKEGAKALPEISTNLRNANIIACAKELHDLGEVSDSDYKETLLTMLKMSGIDLNKKV